MIDAGDFAEARQPGKRSSADKARQHDAVDRNAGIACSLGILADRSNAISEHRVFQDDRQADGGGDGDDDIGMQPRTGNEDRQESSGNDRSRRWCDSGRPGAADQIRRQNDRDEVHHNGDDDFAGASPQSQHRWDESPKAASDECSNEHGRKHQRAGKIERIKADSDGRDSAEIKLAVGPDIPKPATEAENDRERSQNDRCGVKQRLGNRADRLESAAQDFPIG